MQTKKSQHFGSPVVDSFIQNPDVMGFICLVDEIRFFRISICSFWVRIIVLCVSNYSMSFFFHSGATTPGMNNHKENLSVPTANGQLLEELSGSMGMSRSTTASPIPPIAQSTAWMSCRKIIYVKTNNKMPVAHWPIPESFWPDPSLQTLVSLVFPCFIKRKFHLESNRDMGCGCCAIFNTDTTYIHSKCCELGLHIKA